MTKTTEEKLRQITPEPTIKENLTVEQEPVQQRGIVAEGLRSNITPFYKQELYRRVYCGNKDRK